MKPIIRALWIIIAGASLVWLIVEPNVFKTLEFLPLRNLLVQYSGFLAIVSMSVAMVLATRPVWLESRVRGLDKMYRLHKWLGIGALVFSVSHWLFANGPKWAVDLGLMERRPRGPRPEITDPVLQWFISQRKLAEFVGEWTFYLMAALIIVALIKWFPYRIFYQTHRLLAGAYLALVFHAIILTKFDYWLTPVGFVLAPLLLAGSVSAVFSLFRRIGRGRKADGTIRALQYYPGVRALEVSIDVPTGWGGHKPGQFAFVTSDAGEGAHPYTIASAWDESERRITFIVKSLGDHTKKLPANLTVGQDVKVEGPYGCFTFADDYAEQVWIGGGIGITPFIARMKQLAAEGARKPQTIHLFHPSADYDAEAFAKLKADAAAAGVNIHVLIDAEDGLLSGARIREAVPGWRNASFWFCGPVGLARALRLDFKAMGAPIDNRFHQELFSMR